MGTKSCRFNESAGRYIDTCEMSSQQHIKNSRRQRLRALFCIRQGDESHKEHRQLYRKYVSGGVPVRWDVGQRVLGEEAGKLS